eukprot:TRINITY_DN28713_c0_g3_i1.p1 TRINITY_DN28713_c0_g3~~TRINITY_DN28713_c0_g3_i1.p1  ORF type:complete len:451 (+),score=76.63 TRINITY_DN28713_c0_g3_i1:21-1373(+)
MLSFRALPSLSSSLSFFSPSKGPPPSSFAQRSSFSPKLRSSPSSSLSSTSLGLVALSLACQLAPHSSSSKWRRFVSEAKVVMPASKKDAAKDSTTPDKLKAEDPGVTPQKRPAKASKTKAETADGDEPPAKKGRTKKPKPEGPYTQFKEQGSIPEPTLKMLPEASIPKGRRRLAMLAWNVGGLRAFLKSKVADLQEAVRKSKPCMLGILEHKLQDGDKDGAIPALLEALPDYEVGAVNYSTAKKGYSGTLVLVRKESEAPLKVEAEDLLSAKDEGRLIVVEYKELYVVLCYVPNSGDGLKRISERIEKWDPELREKLSKLAKKKAVVLLGDLNVAHRDKDIWNVEAPHIPKSAGTTPQERESFSKLLDSGFVDGFSHQHPEVLGAFTYWSVRAGNRKTNRGLRLDYAVASKGMVPSEHGKHCEGPMLVDTFHLTELAHGDHCPVGAVVAL